jgi:transketolase
MSRLADHLSKKIFGKIDKAYSRDGYGEGLVEAGKDPKIVVLSGDLTESTRSNWFKEKFPDRFIEVGVAEQNMMGLAAGLALYGKIPFVSSYAVFNPGRNWDQLRVSVCYSQANVKIAGAHAGISVGPDGATHQALEDISQVRALPNLIIIVPCDYLEAKKATIAAAIYKGPVYLRFGREKVPLITTINSPFKIGKAEIFKEGSDLTIIASGSLVYEALIAAKELEIKHKISTKIINNHTLKPIDKLALTKAAKETGAIVTAEEHQVTGGLGAAVAEVISESYPVPIKRVGMPDCFGESGQPEELMKKYGMSSSNIIKNALSVIKMKK